MLLSILSDGTNLSLWVWIALVIGPVSTVPYRQVAAGILGLAHIVTQLVLLPLPTHNGPLSYVIIQVTGLVGLLLWHQGVGLPILRNRHCDPAKRSHSGHRRHRKSRRLRC